MKKDHQLIGNIDSLGTYTVPILKTFHQRGRKILKDNICTRPKV